MIRTKKAIAAIFRKIADKIEAGTCELNDLELTEVANILVHRKLNAEQVAHHLGVSRTTITRMVADGRIPHPRKLLVEKNIGGRMKLKIVLQSIIRNTACSLRIGL